MHNSTFTYRIPDAARNYYNYSLPQRVESITDGLCRESSLCETRGADDVPNLRFGVTASRKDHTYIRRSRYNRIQASPRTRSTLLRDVAMERWASTTEIRKADRVRATCSNDRTRCAGWTACEAGSGALRRASGPPVPGEGPGRRRIPS